MAERTDKNLQKQVIYSVYIRNHTEEGTFASIEPDLDRIRDLGVDIIWLLPIHPIGVVGKKGSLGCPYANKDYRTTNPAYGTMQEFEHLVDAIHAKGMKCIIDVVYNHTSPDSTLSKEHPEFFYRRSDGNFGNKVGDWTDVIDLDYSNKQLWEYQIASLVQWAKIVDGFRCDVASFVPVEFWKSAREAVSEVNPNCMWLAETVHPNFGILVRKSGFYSALDYEMYEAFDMEYEYDVREVFERYVKGEIQLSHYLDMVNMQEGIYPVNYNKMRYLENHDTKRICSYIKDENILLNYTAYLYFLKGTTLIYAGQEFENAHTPSLFEKDMVDYHTGKDISSYLRTLYDIKKKQLDSDDCFQAFADDEHDIACLVRENASRKKVGIFSLKGKQAEVKVPLSDGEYTNQIDGQTVQVKDEKVLCNGKPMVLIKE